MTAHEVWVTVNDVLAVPVFTKFVEIELPYETPVVPVAKVLG